MNLKIPTRFSLTLAVLLFGIGGMAMWEGQTIRSAQAQGEPVGSLAELTTELRKLRVAVEQSTKHQAQTQALGAYLSVQQNRILQLNSRLDSVRKELDHLTNSSQSFALQKSNTEDALSRMADPNERGILEQQTRQLDLEQKRLNTQIQQERTREAELSQTLQMENDRWNDLASRLEQLIKN